MLDISLLMKPLQAEGDLGISPLDERFQAIAGLVQVGFGGLFELSHFMAWNRGYLIMPFFNMILVAPQHSQEDIDGWLEVWDDFVRIAMGK